MLVRHKAAVPSFLRLNSPLKKSICCERLHSTLTSFSTENDLNPSTSLRVDPEHVEGSMWRRATISVIFGLGSRMPDYRGCVEGAVSPDARRIDEINLTESVYEEMRRRRRAHAAFNPQGRVDPLRIALSFVLDVSVC